MSAYTLLLIVHIVTGSAGLLLGPIVMWVDTRGRDRTYGSVYVALVVAVAISAVGLVVVRRHDLWWLIPVSALTVALAVIAQRRIGRPERFRGHLYVHCQGGSYIALVTATVVVSFALDGPLTGGWQLIAWLGPTAIGAPLLEVWRRRAFGPETDRRSANFGPTHPIRAW
ncbi:hypothetical protein [Nocardia transvalensis]|uniref:hypothetical protein n=1 Tax=Nocardia transvalensis TaxID=37333 RepID=UPI001892DE41|nr:hypothetical protein [Nocardia transvalensis]MBF6329320.1 hypothetical protein [Nocardia transvalensis]